MLDGIIMKVDFSIVDENHIVIQLNNAKALLATGINFSLSNEKSISIMDKTFNLDNQYMGFSLQDIKKFLKIDIDHVIGSNILSHLNYVVDTKHKVVSVSDKVFSASSSMIQVPLTYNFEIPSIQVSLESNQIQAVLDTLSNYSYLHEKNLQNLPEIGEKDDFMIGMGNFKTKIYQAHYSIGDSKIMLETGYYPLVISKSRFISTDKGILGSELFSKFSITFNAENKQLYLD